MKLYIFIFESETELLRKNFELLSKLKLIEEALLEAVAVFVGDLHEVDSVAVRVAFEEASDRQEVVLAPEAVLVDLEGALAVQEASVGAGAVGENQHQLMLVS